MKIKEAKSIGESTTHTRCGWKCPRKGTNASRAHQHQGLLVHWLLGSWTLKLFGFEFWCCCWFLDWLLAQLIESGEKERLMELLRERLVDCGWKDEMKAICRFFFLISYFISWSWFARKMYLLSIQCCFDCHVFSVLEVE